MSLKASVPRDLSKVKTKVALNLTARQLICSGIGIAFALPVFFFLKRPLGMEASAIGCMIVCVPFFVLGIYEKNGLPAEKLLFYKIRMRHLRVGNRPKVVVTKFEEEEKMDGIRKEIEKLEKKAKRRSGRAK